MQDKHFEHKKKNSEAFGTIVLTVILAFYYGMIVAAPVGILILGIAAIVAFLAALRNIWYCELRPMLVAA